MEDREDETKTMKNSENLKTFSGSKIVGWGEVERNMILQSLTKTGGNRSKAAELLGWSRSKLWRKIKHHGLE
ncbi:helix-turn-helix domain-containing protein [Thermodesulfobacteriota bacterium]